MKSLHIGQNELLIVGVPEGAVSISLHHYTFGDTDIIFSFGDLLYDYSERIRIDVPGSWQLLGRGSGLTEDIAKGIVESKMCIIGERFQTVYGNYDDGDGFDTAIESLFSLIRREGHEPENTIILLKNG